MLPSADVGVYDESPPNDSDARPTISLIEQWEEGAHVPRIANARDYSFPKSLVIPYTWNSASRALSLSDALNHVSLHDEEDDWGPATYTQPVPGVNHPNQPRRDPSSDLSDPLTYWWGAILCPPELNDVALAETVAIMMRFEKSTSTPKFRSRPWLLCWNSRVLRWSVPLSPLRTRRQASTPPCWREEI